MHSHTVPGSWSARLLSHFHIHKQLRGLSVLHNTCWNGLEEMTCFFCFTFSTYQMLPCWVSVGPKKIFPSPPQPLSPLTVVPPLVLVLHFHFSPLYLFFLYLLPRPPPALALSFSVCTSTPHQPSPCTLQPPPPVIIFLHHVYGGNSGGRWQLSDCFMTYCKCGGLPAQLSACCRRAGFTVDVEGLFCTCSALSGAKTDVCLSGCLFDFEPRQLGWHTCEPAEFFFLFSF